MLDFDLPPPFDLLDTFHNNYDGFLYMYQTIRK